MTWTFKVKDIKRLHFEISNYCNLSCPSCARASREKNSLPLNSNYLPFSLIKEKFKNTDMPEVTEISFCGNIDEPTIHPELENILIYVCTEFPKAYVSLSTNGSTRDINFWQRLGKISSEHNFHVIFAIDGLEDTNHLYRIGSSWDKIVRNFRSFLSVPGAKARWQFVVFNHNEHQIQEAKLFSEKEKFSKFSIRYSGRDHQEKNINVFNKNISQKEILIKCKSQIKVRHTAPSIFINYTGDVTPCCYQDINHYTVRIELSEIIESTCHSLYKGSLHDIIEGDFFNKLSGEISKNKVCNKHCKENKTDVIIKL
jgi:MoaA/NifB/PqqE/SkfB family radical SAM enzyme